MNDTLNYLKTAVYDKCSFVVSNVQPEPESKEYKACRFELSGRNIVCRNAKITPKKAGQFVTFWKRSENGPIAPFDATDPIDFFVVNVRTEQASGQFVFPKSVLIRKGILSTGRKEGKRAFRVYPPWDVTHSKQAERTGQWQLMYFYEIGETTDLKKVHTLYDKKASVPNNT